MTYLAATCCRREMELFGCWWWDGKYEDTGGSGGWRWAGITPDPRSASSMSPPGPLRWCWGWDWLGCIPFIPPVDRKVSFSKVISIFQKTKNFWRHFNFFFEIKIMFSIDLTVCLELRGDMSHRRGWRTHRVRFPIHHLWIGMSGEVGKSLQLRGTPTAAATVPMMDPHWAWTLGFPLPRLNPFLFHRLGPGDLWGVTKIQIDFVVIQSIFFFF